jgi:hypothetical protein
VFSLVDTSGFKDLEWPEALKGSWLHIVLFKDHPNPKVDGIGSLYINDKYPSGSVFVGDHILNDYPDGYATIKKLDNDEGFSTGRIFVSPPFRRKGIASAATAYSFLIMNYLYSKNVVHLAGSEIGNKAVVNAAKMGNFDFDLEKAEVEEGFHMKEEFFEQPVYPTVFFGKRMSKF